MTATQTELEATTDSFAQTEIEEMDARKRLAALKLLKTRHDKIVERQQARKDYWRNTLTEITQALNEAIDAAIPVRDEQCRKSLLAIKGKRAESIEAKENKAAELKDLKAAIARIEATMDDLMLKGVGDQMSLDLGADQSAWLTKDVAEQVNLALSAKETRAASEGEEMAPDLVALRQQLASMGFEALVVKEDEEDEVQASEASETAEDETSEDETGDDESDDVEDEDLDYEEDPTDYDDADNVISLAGNA